MSISVTSLIFLKQLSLVKDSQQGLVVNKHGQWTMKTSMDYGHPMKACQRYLKNWVDVADKICFGRTNTFRIGIEFLAMQAVLELKVKN